MIYKYEPRVTGITVLPEGVEIYDDRATEITIADEGGGEFIQLSQTGSDGKYISIDPAEWQVLRDAIDSMVNGLRG